MNQNFYQTLQTLQSHIYKQDQVIQHLLKKIKSIETKVEQLEKRPPVHVERMEYKFDQLKVESLEGTLNIGLNPSDLQGIEDLSIPSQKGTLSPQDRMSLFTEIENSIQNYLDTSIQNIVQNTAEPLQIQVDETYYQFILQDIRKQIPNRIEYYLNQPLRKDHSGSDQQKEWIIEQLKKEIQNGVLLFIKNLPENMKGTKTE
jgi:spore germination protein PC